MKMAGDQIAYVEDYNSQISEVVPFTRRHAHPKMRSTLETHFEDSGYESGLPSEHPSTTSPEESATPTPQNDTPSPPPAEEEYAESEIQFPARQPRQYAYAAQSASSPLSRRLSTHQLSSQAPSSNPTPSASKASSVKSASRSGSPAVHRGSSTLSGPSNTTASTAITEDENCDCPECKTTSKSSPTDHHSALSSSWNLNYPPFNNSGAVPASPHSSQHWPNYANVTPGRSYSRDYPYAYPLTPTTTDSGDSEPGTRRIRDRLPARPLSYGCPTVPTASNLVTTNNSWNTYSYYGHLPGATTVSTPPPTYGPSSYSPPPVTPSSAAVPATPSSQLYSAAMIGGGGGYSSYPYSSNDYYSQTQVAAATPSVPAASNAPPPSAIPYRRSNRYSTGGMNSPVYSSSIEYAERYHERYAREYAEKYGSYSDKYSDKSLDKYSEKYYSEKYPDRNSDKYGEKYTEKYGDKYGDKYANRYYEKYPEPYSSDKYTEKYGDYHQQNPPVSRRLSQRTPQGSGTYNHSQDALPRSTSVPPADPNAPTSTDLKRRTATPQPMRRRDSTSGSASSGALARLSSSSFPRSSGDNDDDYYGQTPPSSYNYHRYHSSYDAHAPSHHALTTQQSGGMPSYYYRGSDSGYSGGSSEHKGDEMVPLTVSDGEPFTIRYPTGIPVKLQLNGGTQMTIQLGSHDKKNNIESSATYRYIQSQQRQQLALQHDISPRGSSRQLEYDRGYRGSANSDADYYTSRMSEREDVFRDLDDNDRPGYPLKYRRRGSMGAF